MNLTQQEIKSLIHLAEKESSFSSVVDKLKTHIKVESKRGQLCRVWDDDNDTFFLQVCAGDGEFLNDACFLDEQKVCEWENFQPLPFFIDIEASRKKGEVVPVEALTPVVTWVEGDKDSITLEFDNEPLPKKWETLTKDNWEQYRDKIVWCRDLDPNFLCRCKLISYEPKSKHPFKVVVENGYGNAFKEASLYNDSGERAVWND